MTTYGSWVQAPDHEFDYYAALTAGHPLDPEVVDPEFANLGYTTQTDGRRWRAFRPVGGRTLDISNFDNTTRVPPTGGTDDVNVTNWMNGNYTTATARDAAVQAVWRDLWDDAKDFTPTDTLTQNRSFYGDMPGGGAKLRMTWEPNHSFPWNNGFASMYNAVAVHYYSIDASDLLPSYRPVVSAPDGAYVEWEGPATVVGAGLYVKIGDPGGGIYGFPGEPTTPPSAYAFAFWDDRVIATTSPLTYTHPREWHSSTYACSAVLRQFPTPSKTGPNLTYHRFTLDVPYVSPSTFAALPVIYDGPPVYDEPTLIDVTEFLDPEDGNSLSLAVHLSDLQLDGVLPDSLTPAGYDIGKSYYAEFTARGGGWFDEATPNPYYTIADGDALVPHMVWTLRPPRYRFVYEDVQVTGYASAEWNSFEYENTLTGDLTTTAGRFLGV